MNDSMAPEVSSDDKLWSALGYIFSPIVPIIMLLIEEKKNRKFIKYHSVQSLALGIALFVIIGVTAPFTLGCTSLLWLIAFYYAYKSYQGEYVEIPVLTNLIKGQGWV